MAKLNRSITLSTDEITRLKKSHFQLNDCASEEELYNKIICADLFDTMPLLPTNFVDLLIIDPPYNLDKKFNGKNFKKSSIEEYEDWVDSWFKNLIPVLKEHASVYVCCDWYSSSSIFRVMSRYLKIRNRISWEREKGRGALQNWKNCLEDIWFATVSNEFTFNVDAVKLRRKVIAPYKDKSGNPKDWIEGKDGNYRITSPSNIWTDITVPFWSMPENTEHPTQKPEKLIAKLILASSCQGDMVFDPFVGSGTSAVTAKKLGRRYLGIEKEERYACFAAKRLEMCNDGDSIQGYEDGIFWERNSKP